jgi:hypothetical protein
MRLPSYWPIVIAAMLGSPVRAQIRDTVVQFPLRLLDMGIQARSRHGVFIGAAPSVQSVQGYASTGFVSLQLHPDTVLSWAGHAEVVLKRPLVTEPEERIQWTRELRDFQSDGSLILGRTVRDGRLRGDRWLSVGDSTHRWRVKVSEEEADSLLRILFAVASVADVPDTIPRAFPDDSVDTPVEAVNQPRPEFAGMVGRVIAQYTVGADGRVEPESIVLLLASHPKLEREARAVLLASRFRPAMKQGQPIRQLVHQTLVWRYSP